MKQNVQLEDKSKKTKYGNYYILFNRKYNYNQIRKYLIIYSS